MRPLTLDEQIKRPYALGTIEILPARQQSFVRTSVLNLVFFVYNRDRRTGNRTFGSTTSSSVMKENLRRSVWRNSSLKCSQPTRSQGTSICGEDSR